MFHRVNYHSNPYEDEWYCGFCYLRDKRGVKRFMTRSEKNLWVCHHCFKGMALFEGRPGVVLGLRPKSKLALLWDT
jgi:hypothetical protein